MAGLQRGSVITTSLLDRLMDDAPFEATDPPRNLYQDFESLKSAVKRDLELLLNTRRETQPRLDDYPEARHSLLTYGLPDFSALSYASDDDRKRMREEIESSIRIFEPRLADVHVAIGSPDSQTQRLSFRVDALLRVDPAPAPVTFDAVVEITTQQYQIQG
ncbi:MAG TPA: type VI secretion system baseplate subunit TssE [Burkholderiales bacterium]|nr:type VI secretion system baseplate subunit TssE [Burkholderiales bacterium]